MIRSELPPRAERRATGSTKLRASLEAVSLEPADVLGKYPHQLSGGQLQRLMIARALLLDIKFLVADEIISMLDASTRIDVLNLLGDLKARGLGILFITHDLSLGNYISDRTADPAPRARRRDGGDAEGLRQPAPSVHADAARVGPAAPRPLGRPVRAAPRPRTAQARSSRPSRSTSSPPSPRPTVRRPAARRRPSPCRPRSVSHEHQCRAPRGRCPRHPARRHPVGGSRAGLHRRRSGARPGTRSSSATTCRARTASSTPRSCHTATASPACSGSTTGSAR